MLRVTLSFLMCMIICGALHAAGEAPPSDTVKGATISPARILFLYSNDEGINGGRFTGRFWGPDYNREYTAPTLDFLTNCFGSEAWIESYDVWADPRRITSNQIESGTDGKLAFLNQFDLIFIDNSCPSAVVRGSVEAMRIWNEEVKAAILVNKGFVTHPGRWDWFKCPGSPAENAGTTPTEVLGLANGGEVQLFRTAPYDDQPTVWYRSSIRDGQTSQTHLAQRQYIADMTNNNGTVVARWPGYTNSLALAKWTNIGQPYYEGSAYSVGGPRMLLVCNDDRNQIPPDLIGLAEFENKGFNCYEKLTEEGRAFLRQQIVDLVPALAPRHKILLIGAHGNPQVDGSNVNGGRFYGNFWGPKRNDRYESVTFHLLEDFFAPNSVVDFYEISTSDYLNMAGMDATTTAPQAFLNGYDLIIQGHTVPTSLVGSGSFDRSREWMQSIFSPLIVMNQFIARTSSSRWALLEQFGGPIENEGTTATELLDIRDPAHSAFHNVDVSSGTLQLFNPPPYEPGTLWYNGTTATNFRHFNQRSQIDDLSNSNGNRIAEFRGTTNWCNIIVWDAGIPPYTGSPLTPAGPRILLNITDARNQIDPLVTQNLYKSYNCLSQLTPEGRQFLKDLLISVAPQIETPIENEVNLDDWTYRAVIDGAMTGEKTDEGLCISALASDDAFEGWSSDPAMPFELIDHTAYRFNFRLSTTASVGETPILHFVVNNTAGTIGDGYAYGGEFFVLDQEQGANAIANRNGGEYTWYFTPAQALLPGWRDAINGAFAPSNAGIRNFRMEMNVCDIDGVGLAEYRSGTVCLNQLVVTRMDLNDLATGVEVYSVGNFNAQNFGLATGLPTINGSLELSFNTGAMIVEAQNSSLSLLNVEPSNGSPTQLYYPITADTEKTYRIEWRTEASFGTVPIEIIRLNADLSTNEIIQNSYAAASSFGLGELALPVIGENFVHYTMLFHAHTPTFSILDAKWRPSLSIANREDVHGPEPANNALVFRQVQVLKLAE